MIIRDYIGEGTEYDKKEALEVKRPKSWLKSVSAFANGQGGVLLFGITDDDDLVGLKDAEKDAENISEIIKNRMDPIPDIGGSIRREVVDASKLGKEYKDANSLKKVRLEDDEIEKIVTAFRNAQPIDDFSAVVSYAEVKAKGYSLSAGQYFDIKIDYVDITEDEFNAQMKADMDELESMFAESHRLEDEIRLQLKSLKFVE